MKPNHISGYRAVVISSLVSVGDVLLSFIAAAITGSTVMLSQGLQGFADLTTTLFLLLGVKRSKRAATATHPFGFGRELFFWVLIASLFAFLFSGGVASFRAIQQIIDGSPIESVYVAFIVLFIGSITNGYSLATSYRRISQNAGGRSLFSYMRRSSLVETKMTLLVDFMGALSAVLGLIALSVYAITGNPVYDGIGALVIGLLTATGALFVIIDLHDLIVGRSPSTEVIENIRKAAQSVKGVNEVLDLRASSVGSGQVLALLEIHFADNKTTDEIEKITDEIKEKVLAKVPQVAQVQVEAETPD